MSGSSTVSTQQQFGKVSDTTDSPDGHTAVDEIAAQESDEGADGTMEQSYDMAAVVEGTAGLGLAVGSAESVPGTHTQRNRALRNKRRREKANQAATNGHLT